MTEKTNLSNYVYLFAGPIHIVAIVMVFVVGVTDLTMFLLFEKKLGDAVPNALLAWVVMVLFALHLKKNHRDIKKGRQDGQD